MLSPNQFSTMHAITPSSQYLLYARENVKSARPDLRQPVQAASDPSDVTHRGARSAIHVSARFSAAAVSDRFTRRAVAKCEEPAIAVLIVFSFGMGYLCSALQVFRNVNSSDSRGTLSTNGPTAHPNPVESRASVKPTQSAYTNRRLVPHSSSTYSAATEIRVPCPARRARSVAVPASSISVILVLREMLYPCWASSRP